MIPGVIHWIWLSGDTFPPLVEQCLQSWKSVHPELEIRKWDLSSIASLDTCKWLEETLSLHRWPFASDYLRAEILYKYGGIYLDSDIFLRHSLQPLLAYSFVGAIEFHREVFLARDGPAMLDGLGNRRMESSWQSLPGLGVQAAFMASVPEHPYLLHVKQYYESIPYVLCDGRLNESEIAPGIYALLAEQYGFKWVDRMQTLDEGMTLLPSSCVGGTPQQVNASTLAFHCCANSWRR